MHLTLDLGARLALFGAIVIAVLVLREGLLRGLDRELLPRSVLARIDRITRVSPMVVGWAVLAVVTGLVIEASVGAA